MEIRKVQIICVKIYRVWSEIEVKNLNSWVFVIKFRIVEIEGYSIQVHSIIAGDCLDNQTDYD